MDRQRLVAELGREFDGSEQARRVVSRQARDLADSGRLESDLDVELSTETVLSNLADAPGAHSLTERWNWWIGSLELSHGGYQRFRVRAGIETEE